MVNTKDIKKRKAPRNEPTINTGTFLILNECGKGDLASSIPNTLSGHIIGYNKWLKQHNLLNGIIGK